MLLSREELCRRIDEAPSRPLLVGEAGMRLSLAGAQTKLALCKSGDDWMRPAPGAISTHMLKPPIRDLPDSIENEAFCITPAAHSGLGVPECWIERDPDLYVVQRYDRIRDPASGRVKRLHQEDFCQTLGIAASNKYETEGGPSLKDCLNFVRRVSSDPAGELLRLLDWVIFNFMIGNHDAHAKNLSLLYSKRQVRLAPFCDLLSIAAYPTPSEKFAMRIGGAESVRSMAMRHWRKFAEDCGLQPKFVWSCFIKVMKQMEQNARDLIDDFGGVSEHLKNVGDVLLARGAVLKHMLEADQAHSNRPSG